jgi:hypothetical protein
MIIVATGVEITTFCKNRFDPVLSASTLRSKSKTQLNSSTDFKSTSVWNYSTFTRYYKRSLFINEEFYVFLNTLDQHDVDTINSAVVEIKNHTFVESIDFEISETPTIIIKLSEVNRENKNKIYEIEYNLLRETRADIDFYIRPF